MRGCRMRKSYCILLILILGLTVFFYLSKWRFSLTKKFQVVSETVDSQKTPPIEWDSINYPSQIVFKSPVNQEMKRGESQFLPPEVNIDKHIIKNPAVKKDAPLKLEKVIEEVGKIEKDSVPDTQPKSSADKKPTRLTGKALSKAKFFHPDHDHVVLSDDKSHQRINKQTASEEKDKKYDSSRHLPDVHDKEKDKSDLKKLQDLTKNVKHQDLHDEHPRPLKNDDQDKDQAKANIKKLQDLTENVKHQDLHDEHPRPLKNDDQGKDQAKADIKKLPDLTKNVKHKNLEDEHSRPRKDDADNIEESEKKEAPQSNRGRHGEGKVQVHNGQAQEEPSQKKPISPHSFDEVKSKQGINMNKKTQKEAQADLAEPPQHQGLKPESFKQVISKFRQQRQAKINVVMQQNATQPKQSQNYKKFDTLEKDKRDKNATPKVKPTPLIRHNAVPNIKKKKSESLQTSFKHGKDEIKLNQFPNSRRNQTNVKVSGVKTNHNQTLASTVTGLLQKAKSKVSALFNDVPYLNRLAQSKVKDPKEVESPGSVKKSKSLNISDPEAKQPLKFVEEQSVRGKELSKPHGFKIPKSLNVEEQVLKKNLVKTNTTIRNKTQTHPKQYGAGHLKNDKPVIHAKDKHPVVAKPNIHVEHDEVQNKRHFRKPEVIKDHMKTKEKVNASVNESDSALVEKKRRQMKESALHDPHSFQRKPANHRENIPNEDIHKPSKDSL